VGVLKISPSSFISGDFANQYTISRLPTNALRSGESDTICVLFKPTREGLNTATLNILGNAMNSPLQISLRGIGVIPKLVVTPNPLQFDSVRLGDSATRTLTLSNPGTDTLAIIKNFFSSADADFTLRGLSGEDTLIPPETQKTITVLFRPVRNGTRVAHLEIFTNIPTTFDNPARDTSTTLINVSGTGVPAGKLFITGVSDLDSILVNTQDCQDITIVNSGESDITLTSDLLSGPESSEFSVNNVTLPLTIPAGGSHSATLCATPTARAIRNAALTLSGTTDGSPISFTMPLAVFGLSVCAQSTPATLFTEVTPINKIDTGTVTITNCGDVATTYTASLPNGCGGYLLLTPTTSSSIAPGATATFHVSFAPSASGPATCLLTVNGVVTGTPTTVTPMTVQLSGTGACAQIATGQFTAPSTSVGAPVTVTVPVTNNGNLDWTPNNATFSPTGDFTFTGSTPATIAAGGNGTLTFTYNPATVGTTTTTVTFPNAEGVECASFSLTLSGTAAQSGVQEVVALNGFALEQNYPNPFNPTTEIGYTVPVDAVVTITVSDLKGSVVKTLIQNERTSAGHHTVQIDAKTLPSGVYYYTLTSGTLTGGATRLTKQMILAK